MGLTDSQLATVMDAARTLPVEKRDLYLQRLAAMLTMRGRGHFNDADVTDVARLSMAGLSAMDAPAATARAMRGGFLIPAPGLRHDLDTKARDDQRCLILLALPRGLEPLFSP